jgi:hypothetical protein
MQHPPLTLTAKARQRWIGHDLSFLLMPGASVLERAWGHPLVSPVREAVPSGEIKEVSAAEPLNHGLNALL